MPVAAIKAYLERLPAVQAQDKLVMFEAANAVWMERHDKRRTLRGWQRLAFGEVPAKLVEKKDLPVLGLGKG